MKPFIKWAGGKTQLLESIREKYPEELGISLTKYCEPFVGGGAILFDIISQYNMREVMINDMNSILINLYKVIKNDVYSLIKKLKKIELIYHNMDRCSQQSFYYKCRDRFNILITKDENECVIEKAYLFIFLNKTCFNGLYRVNSKGLFNVSFGKYNNPLICDEENLLSVSKVLKTVKIITGEYNNTIDFIDNTTFVYIDPPYRILSDTSNFNSYTRNIFDDENQCELKIFIDEINEKGAKVLISNSDPKNTNKDDNFFDELYKKYKINRVDARRMINCIASSRGEIKELLISNY